MVIVCPKCGGKTPNCIECGNPPKRKAPPVSKATKVRSALLSLVQATVPIYTVNGIDISSWNGIMDLRIAKSKVQFAFIRAGYGEIYKDYRSDTYRQDANAIDFPYGLYWYCYPKYSWQKHAEAFAEVAARYPYQLPLIIDAEAVGYDMVYNLNWYKNMHNYLYQLTGKYAYIYTSKGYWNANVAYDANFVKWVKWLASWTTGYPPAMPYGVTSWDLWQWSADGNGKAREYGMIRDGDADMDLNRYYGTAQQFDAQYGTHISPEPPPPPSPILKPIKSVYVNTAALNMRNQANPIIDPSTDIGTISYNDDVPVMEESGDWYRIEGWILKSLTRPK